MDNSPVKHFLLKFDVTGINGQAVTNAKLCLYNVNSANEGGDFYHVNDDSWQEETVTWNNAPAADTTLLASLGTVSVNTWYEVDLTSLVTADGTYSLRVSDSVGGADYSSKEGANDPKLLVSLAGAPAQSCAPAATPTATPGPTNTPTNTSTPGPSPTPTNTSTPTSISTPTATVPPPVPFNNATFVYDGDGKRVKSTFNGTTTTYFVGAHYEVTGSTITKYYYAGSQRIAMRTNGTLNYLLSDHLGSTSLTTNASGQIVSELRYKAWGEVRYASDNIPTKYQYTGQYSDSYINLLWYGSRHYDPELGRFIQPDSIVPLASQGVQAWDRFGYVNNNPVRYTDPSGHCIGLIDCVVKVIKATTFLANRAIDNGELTDADFEDAADYAAPALASGSKESVSGFISEFVTGVASNTLITTSDGQTQLFNETGIGGALPGAGISVTHGEVYGLESDIEEGVMDPFKYEGGATQGNISIPLPVCDFACGPYIEGYISDDHQVWGIDVGLEAGIGPTILATAHTIAERTDRLLWTFPGNWLNRTGEDKLKGPELLGCRLLSMCGAR